VVATARCELVRELVADGHARCVAWEGDRAANLRDLLGAIDVEALHARRASGLTLATRYSVEATTAGLRAWVGRARRAPAGNPGRGG
jgi:hypothetical protein